MLQASGNIVSYACNVRRRVPTHCSTQLPLDHGSTQTHDEKQVSSTRGSIANQVALFLKIINKLYIGDLAQHASWTLLKDTSLNFNLSQSPDYQRQWALKPKKRCKQISSDAQTGAHCMATHGMAWQATDSFRLVSTRLLAKPQPQSWQLLAPLLQLHKKPRLVTQTTPAKAWGPLERLGGSGGL